MGLAHWVLRWGRKDLKRTAEEAEGAGAAEVVIEVVSLMKALTMIVIFVGFLIEKTCLRSFQILINKNIQGNEPKHQIKLLKMTYYNLINASRSQCLLEL